MSWLIFLVGLKAQPKLKKIDCIGVKDFSNKKSTIRNDEMISWFMMDTHTTNIKVDPNVANAGGLQSQGVKGEVVVFYFEPLTTQNLKSSGVPGG